MTRFVPPVEKRIPSLAEREPYDALDPKQILFASRLDERLQEIAAERGHRDDAQLLVARMRAISDPAKMSSEQYRKSPLVR